MIPLSSTSDVTSTALSSGDGLESLLARTRAALYHTISPRIKAQLGITISQARILLVLANRPPCMTAELARELDLASSAITRAIDRMEQCGLLTRKGCDSDRRIVRLQITQTARLLADRIPEIISTASDELLSILASDEILSLKRMLGRAVENGMREA
ncbi:MULTISPECIES: MarR family winged helix-turn-helix transcriptional regulator [Burkholderia cepacia complex]|uniref:MarR family winged helix-turn-helix transcriptional regulator n=1 Tax=Burkholderia cepacia complex TaxID=87882 RepID=UPI0007C81515|nr:MULTISPECIES: MarR family transcriptional regulator [Burkholderia cepacia complex]